MDWIAELVKNAPEIIKAAGSGTLALGAFFLLLGTLLIIYILKEVAAGWRFTIVVIWLIVGLVLFLIVAGPAPNYRGRLDGQSVVLGKSFILDLGYIQRDTAHEAVLDLGLEYGSASLRVMTSDTPLGISWASGAEVETVHDRGFTRLRLRLPEGGDEKPQVLHARLSPDGLNPTRKAPLDLTVKFVRLAATQPISRSSGPQSSGTGQDFSPPYTVCAPVPQPGDYEVVEGSVQGSLTGDRSCGAYSTCRTENRLNAACLVFSLQGHNECSGGGFLGIGGGNCASVRMSEGHVSAVAALKPSNPKLAADQS